MLSAADARKESERKVTELGLVTNPHLPLLDGCTPIRTCDEIVDRLFAMFAAVAVHYGFDRASSQGWLEREGAAEAATEQERAVIETGETGDFSADYAIEAMWALCWSIGIVAELDFTASCSDSFVSLMPDLKKNESGQRFRSRAVLRSEAELCRALDLAYCLHWSMVHARLHAGAPTHQGVAASIVPRRHALEWIMSTDSWDDVQLET